MTFDFVLRGPTIYSGSDTAVADIGIVGEKIVAIGDLAGAPCAHMMDCSHLAALPGLIDTQVHFREPGMEHKEDLESGSRAAMMGGVTTFFEMPNTSPTTVNEEALNDKLARAKGRSWSNYAFFVGATAENATELGRLEQLPGTPGIKIFMGSSTGSLLVPDDDTLRTVLRHARKRCPVHAEDHARLEERKALLSAQPHPREHPYLRDAECARKATERLLRIAEEENAKVHVLHVSTADELPLLAEGRRKGVCTCEVTPQHLWFAAPDCYDRLGSLAQMNPPVRDDSHRQALRKALTDGCFDVIGSDHAPHTLEEKALPYPKSPSGMPGVQTMLPAFLTLAQRDRLLSVNEVVRLGCENPARIYNIRDKGFIKEGFDADLVLVDLQMPWTFSRDDVESKCGWSPFEGERFLGKPVHVFVNGMIGVYEGERIGEPAGRMVEFL